MEEGVEFLLTIIPVKKRTLGTLEQKLLVSPYASVLLGSDILEVSVMF
jgi:hypothetical protein